MTKSRSKRRAVAATECLAREHGYAHCHLTQTRFEPQGNVLNHAIASCDCAYRFARQHFSAHHRT
jgi:hypothetical protein